MTEVEARVLLRNCHGIGGLEAWIAGRRWHVTSDGWIVDGMLHGWRFGVEAVGDELRLTAKATDDHAPAIWRVRAQ